MDIYVVDVDEAPEETGATTIEYTENSKDAVVTLTAGDPEGATPITWSLPADNADPDGGGDLVADDAEDNGDFNISQDGVLEFMSPPNYESPVDDDTDNSYSVVVQATDGDTGATPEDTRRWFKVIINVSDVEEQGTITLRPDTQGSTTLLQPQVGVQVNSDDLMDGDGGSGARGTPAITTATYQWYRTTNMSAMGIAISGATLANYTPVHLQGGNSDIGRYLRVVATYDDGKGER